MPRLMIVDDEPEITAMLKRYFTREGYETVTALTGAEALKKLSSVPDMVLLDVNLPDMDGFAVCRALREHLDCPVLFLTARVEDADKLSGFASGGDDYVLKPFSIDELGARVAAHLRRETRRARAAVVRMDGRLAINYTDRTVTFEGKRVGAGRHGRRFAGSRARAPHPGGAGRGGRQALYSDRVGVRL